MEGWETAEGANFGSAGEASHGVARRTDSTASRIASCTFPCSRNLTSCLVGWTFTSTSAGGTWMKRTTAG